MKKILLSCMLSLTISQLISAIDASQISKKDTLRLFWHIITVEWVYSLRETHYRTTFNECFRNTVNGIVLILNKYEIHVPSVITMEWLDELKRALIEAEDTNPERWADFSEEEISEDLEELEEQALINPEKTPPEYQTDLPDDTSAVPLGEEDPKKNNALA